MLGVGSMRPRSCGWAFAPCAALLLASNCGQEGSSEATDGAVVDASSGDAFDDRSADASAADVAHDTATDVAHDAAMDVAHDTATMDGLADASGDGTAIDANVCIPDSATVVCCCEGDIGATVVCNADGSLSCENSVFPSVPFQVYFGEDCLRACGPCSIPCVDSGNTSNEAGAEAGGDATH
jgi:hypothetical protein